MVKDRWWDEDKHGLFLPGLGEIWSAMTDLAVSLLWMGGERSKPITKKAMAMAMKPIRFLEKLGY